MNQHPLEKTIKEYDSLFQGWFKNLLGISTGALALLASFLPTAALPSPDKYVLAVCWLSFVLCILSALVASFRPIILARLNLDLNLTLLDSKLGTPEFEKAMSKKSPRWKMKLIDCCQIVSIVSFCTSFLSLAVFALLRTLQT